MTLYEIDLKRENGEATTRTVTFRDTTYDLQHRPHLHSALFISSMTFFFALIASLLSASVYLLNQALTELGVSTTAVISTVAVALAIWLGLAAIKYLLTGTTEPFITINIDTNIIRTTTDEPENTDN